MYPPSVKVFFTKKLSFLEVKRNNRILHRFIRADGDEVAWRCVVLTSVRRVHSEHDTHHSLSGYGQESNMSA